MSTYLGRYEDVSTSNTFCFHQNSRARISKKSQRRQRRQKKDHRFCMESGLRSYRVFSLILFTVSFFCLIRFVYSSSNSTTTSVCCSEWNGYPPNFWLDVLSMSGRTQVISVAESVCPEKLRLLPCLPNVPASRCPAMTCLSLYRPHADHQDWIDFANSFVLV